MELQRGDFRMQSGGNKQMPSTDVTHSSGDSNTEADYAFGNIH
jgi:hypothetical protein